MTTRENELHRARFATKRAKQKKKQQWQSALDAPFALANPHQVLTFHEWCQLNRISVRTGRRIIASGNGRTVTQMSANRMGVTIGDNAVWQASCAR